MTLRSGDVFANRFEIDRAAGAGGMGAVYRARDQLTSDWVALKLLHDQGPGGSDTERFAREALLLSELRHPGIVAHVAHGQTPQGQRFLAMQWLEGQDLAQRLASGPLTLSDALTLTARVAEALAFAHSHGVVHRDIKPTNLFLPGGDIAKVKLLDFGIARRLASSRPMTRTGMVIGTPEYMAPEQARGVRQLSPAADLFSLGCVLYECLTGEPPFVADHIAAVLVRVLFEEPVPAARRRVGIPEAVNTLLSLMLEKDPARRLSDATQVTRVVAGMGDLPDLRLLPTFPSPQKNTPAQTDSEQVLLSLVLAISPQDFAGGNSTMLSSDAVAQSEQHGPLLVELRGMGVQADLLLGGALVVTVAQLPSARDQAASAARLATLIKERWPEAHVVVVTGRGSRSRGGLTGEVLDRAWRLLRRTATPPTGPATSTQIRIDHVSAGLLESRFAVAPLSAEEEGFVLGSERLDADTGRLLLGKPTPCLGRDRELATLEGIYGECKEDLVARAVLVLGPPGLGKSRLRHEFLRRLERRGTQGIVLIGRSDPMKVKSAYGILGDALRKRLDLREGQDLAEQRERIRQRLAAALPASEALRVTIFIGEICGVSFPDDESPLIRAARQDPRIMSDQVERAWLDGLQMMRTDDPMLLILEDLHWSDALTVKLVGTALRRLRDHAFMVLALARPEVSELYPDLWSGMVQLLPLNPLPRKAGERLIRQILGPDVPSAQLGQIFEQSAGNPLFLEELIRTVAEGKTGELPETVMAMLQARIGRLSVGARRVLRAASVFGETFWENGVQRLLEATHGDESIHNVFEDLVREEIIEKVPEGRFAYQSQYHFRHALVREAVYGLVSEEEKVAWHGVAAKFLEAAGERETILLADHYRLGKERPQAIKCYIKAAEQAYDAGNMDAALACAERGLGCDPTSENRGELLSFLCLIKAWREQYDQALTIGRDVLLLLPPGAKSWCSVLMPLALSTLRTEPGKLPEIMSLLLRMEPHQQILPAYCRTLAFLAITFMTIGQTGPASILRQRTYQLSQRLTDQDYIAWAWHFAMEACHAHFIVKLPQTSVIIFRKALHAGQESGDRQEQGFAGGFLGRALVDLGQRADALPVLRATLSVAEQANDPIPLGFARSYLAEWLADSTSPEDWTEATQLARLSAQSKSPSTLGIAHKILAQIAQVQGDLGTAELEAQTACQIHARSAPYRPDSAARWSQILRQQGKAGDALKVCEEVMQQISTLGIEPNGLLALHLALAEAGEQAGQPETARRAVEQALPILKRRLDDIPNADMRATYLRNVPENARLLELAEKWDLDIACFAQAVAAINGPVVAF